MEQHQGRGDQEKAHTEVGEKPDFLRKKAPSPTPSKPTIAAQVEMTDEQMVSQASGILGRHKKELKDISPNHVKPWKYKDRTFEELRRDETFSEISTDIRSFGVVSPLMVRPIKADDGSVQYEEIYGFKRAEAARRANQQTVTAIVIYDLGDDDAMIIQRSENSGRSNPSAWAQAESHLSYYKNLGTELTDVEVAGRLGGNPRTIANMLRIARNMPESIKKVVHIQQLSSDALKEIVGGSGSPEQHKSRQGFIDLIVQYANEINANPKKARVLIGRLKREFFSDEKIQRPKSNTQEVRLGNGRVAFTWKLGNKGGSLKIHPDIMEHVTEKDLQAFTDRILKRQKN
jgi:ParB/RepB/Spo0J family partition protein